jgi:Cystatin domain
LIFESKKMSCGGISNEKQPTDAVQQVANKVKSEVEAKLARGELTQFALLGFTTQVVAGTNYRLRVRISDTEQVHLVVWHKLDKTYALTSCEVAPL